LLDFLDNTVGKNQYLFFLSADHGAAHVPGFLNNNNIPSGHVQPEPLIDTLNIKLKERFGHENLVVTIVNYQVVLNNHLIDSVHLDKAAITQWAARYAVQQPGILNAYDLSSISQATLSVILKEKIVNSYYPKRSGDIQLLYASQWIDDFEKGGSTHGVWNPYDSHIPLLWYGWNIKTGSTKQEVYITDIAPTLAALLKIQMPSGCTGKVIEDVVKQE
jgi:hypothetical protein